MLFRRPRRRDSDEAWEVVDSQSVEAVPMIYEGTRDFSDVDIQDVADADIVGTYLFEVDPHTRRSRRESFEKAIIFARRELLRETEKRGFNMLLHESWTATLLRRGDRDRVQVRYSGRGTSVVFRIGMNGFADSLSGALAEGADDVHSRPPPYLEVLRN
ncbi:hypothetical protein K525DRAFT_289942 [Schizophyllum commune Loenen D]|nr:hypothetical protein K525DRAFT_289942 [Schizophyllum commune Loenen D]